MEHQIKDIQVNLYRTAIMALSKLLWGSTRGRPSDQKIKSGFAVRDEKAKFDLDRELMKARIQLGNRY